MGKLSDFEQSFEQAWGGLKMLERPAPGNHEYYACTKHGDNEPAQNGTGADPATAMSYSDSGGGACRG